MWTRSEAYDWNKKSESGFVGLSNQGPTIDTPCSLLAHIPRCHVLHEQSTPDPFHDP